MMTCPCQRCERKGCGAYHDECEVYRVYVEERRRERERREAESITLNHRRRTVRTFRRKEE